MSSGAAGSAPNEAVGVERGAVDDAGAGREAVNEADDEVETKRGTTAAVAARTAGRVKSSPTRDDEASVARARGAKEEKDMLKMLKRKRAERRGENVERTQ